MSVLADSGDTDPQKPAVSDERPDAQGTPLPNDPEATAPGDIPPDDSNHKLLEEDGPF